MKKKPDVLQLMRDGDTQRAIKHLYWYFPMVRKYITRNGGDKSDAEDIFQESLVVLYQKSLDATFELTVEAHTYVFRVAQYKWKDELAKKNRLVLQADVTSDYYQETEPETDQDEVLTRVKGVLATLGERCAQILDMYYTRGMQMKDIAEELGYKSVNSAKTQKYKCMEQVKVKCRDVIV